jgi:aldehyde:ferredoxin oxidoreductase
MMKKITYRDGFGAILAEGSQRAAAQIGHGERTLRHARQRARNRTL